MSTVIFTALFEIPSKLFEVIGANNRFVIRNKADKKFLFMYCNIRLDASCQELQPN